MLFAGPHEAGCDACPASVLLIRRDADLAAVAFGFEALLYAALFVVVLVRLILRWRRTPPLERLQLTPVYVCGLLAFLLVTAGTAGAADEDNHSVGRIRRDRGAAGRLPGRGCCAAASRRSTPSFARASRSCAPRARGSWRRARPSAAASSATSTTAPGRGSSASLSCSATRAGGSTPTRPTRRSAGCSTARWRSSRRGWRSFASSRAAARRDPVRAAGVARGAGVSAGARPRRGRGCAAARAQSRPAAT
jgi:hypothetical protein